MTHESAMWNAIAANPMEDLPRLALADWYDENNMPIRAAECRLGVPPVGLVFFKTGDGGQYGDGYGYGDGDGNGDGDGYGRGNGNGNGYGDGYGRGNGNGYGDGYGRGNGNGDGDGDGDGRGDRMLSLGDKSMPEADGKNWFIVLPHGWVIVGCVTEQTGPYQFRVDGAMVICRTGGVPWDELADGKRRDQATYRSWGRVRIGPQFVMARHWEGELPTVK